MADKNSRALAQAFVNSKDDEACIMLLMRMHCIFGDIRRMLKTTKISRYRFEYFVGGGRIDLILFHADGGASLIEVKGNGSVRDVVAGIGQLFLYEAMFLESNPKTMSPAYINKYLVSPVAGNDAQRVAKACDRAGVVFFQYAPFGLIQEHREKCIGDWVSHGA